MIIIRNLQFLQCTYRNKPIDLKIYSTKEINFRIVFRLFQNNRLTVKDVFNQNSENVDNNRYSSNVI